MQGWCISSLHISSTRLSTCQDDVARTHLQIRDAAELLSSNPFAVSHTLAASLILRSIIQGGCENTSLLHIRNLLRPDCVPNTDPGGGIYNGIDTDGISLEIQSVIASIEQQELHIDAVGRFGKQCANPGSFMGALLAIGTSHARMSDGVEYGYVGAVRDVLKSGGCNCSRANFVGACLGAAYGCYDDRDPATVAAVEEDSSCAFRRGRVVQYSIPSIIWNNDPILLNSLLFVCVCI